jgi:hypothetical protein
MNPSIFRAACLMAMGLGVAQAASSATVPKYDHVLVVIMENHDLSEIVGSSQAPYITGLSKQGANFTDSHGVTHPSEPNYVALFSGSTQGLTADTCPNTFTGVNNLGAQLIAAGLTFDGYEESMPSVGYMGCTSGNYVRRHNPWSNFPNVPASVSLPYSSFPKSYTSLPTVSIVVPNLQDDMHNGTVAEGDAWLKANIDGYVQWAKTHNSLFVLTFDEDDSETTANLIPTIVIGADIKIGNYSELINHYNMLATIENIYGLKPLTTATPVTDIFGATAVQLLQNPGFESGATDWKASAGIVSSANGEVPHSGSYYAWFGGKGSPQTDTLSQAVTIPADKSNATLSFWLHIDTQETSTQALDTFTVSVTSGGVTTTLGSFSNLNKNTGYAEQSFDMSKWIGQSVTVTFLGVEKSSLRTSFVLDDVALTAE